MDGSTRSGINDAEVEAVLAEFGGDPRPAIAARLHDSAALAADYQSNVSRGFVRREAADRSLIHNRRQADAYK